MKSALRHAPWMAGCVLLLIDALRPALAANFDGLFAGTNDYGDVGLLQTPTARMRADGEFGIGISTESPYNQIHIFLQALPWLETTVRYTEVTSRRYGSQSFSGNQSYKDKSADLKLRLLREGEWWPSVALGFQDLGGTGLFSSEYLVGSYHWYDLDFSLGLGWGRLGSSGEIGNPFRLFSNHFDHRQMGNGRFGGNLGFRSFFTGHDISPFGGVQWNTPIKGLALQVEYDSNDYQHEALNIKLPQSSPVNVALNYRSKRGLDFGIGFERGERVMARLSLHFNFQNFGGTIKVDDPPLPPLQPADTTTSAAPVSQAPADSTIAAAVAEAAKQAQASLPAPGLSDAQRAEIVLKLKQDLKTQDFEFTGADFGFNDEEIRIWLSGTRFRNPAQSNGRVARVLSEDCPASISKFTIINLESGVETYRVTIDRKSFDRNIEGKTFPVDLTKAITLSAPQNDLGQAAYVDATRYPHFQFDMGPSVRQYIGGPDNFYIGQLYWAFGGLLEVTPHLSFSAGAGVNIVNNFGDLKQESNSRLPHVRSDIVKYLKHGENDVILLETDYIWSPMPEVYARLSAGIFEEMYGGVGGELLYHPYGKPWALGFDVNRVRQRGFDQLFDFRDYTVTTGHLTLYYHLPFYKLLAKVSVGRYLARDKGGTVDLSRQFDSGIRAGIFATKTNVSAAQFGEGRFDKGIYIEIPLDLFTTQSTRITTTIPFRPLTRDGGQKVRDGRELYPIVDGGSPQDFADGWSGFLH